MIQPYTPDVSLKGKLRRRFARLTHRRPVRLNLTRPTISFTFDDIPANAGQAGASALEAQGARGTFYVCAGLFGQEGHMGRFADASEISDLIRRGHEVAGHTFNHLDCHRTPEADLTFDLDANDAALRGLGAAPIHFAYPYGEVSPRAKALLAGRYSSLRGVHKALVHDGDDLNQLPGVGIEGPDGEGVARRWINRAAAENAWLILYTHDVREAHSSWGCTPDALSRLITHAQDAGCDVRTVGEVLAA
ncbi:polysaccharide deacetylase family protein [Brevundimonas pondensis]|jgi:peptidoglycan/xylan/chitin deacetylase (PgdA/CDA1 family)|uniref:Chitooligosaccharide deacetylase n=1 Tax=Brevundimonas pondensis TaxID=2774189 RepID=A0ABX7SJH1_9CAUL|nr:polysaccharide deacetylase family protein [Brevundimonas pondensis]QTC86505.1 polysaccharide deacetylase family protein [Brevundimonas pondensis]